MKIDIQDFQPLVSDSDLQDPLFFQRDLIYKLQNSLMHAAQDMIRALAENPNEAINKFKDYERIILNFAQLIYWMRPIQALQEVKSKLRVQIEGKEQLKTDITHILKDLKNDLGEIIDE